jgi:cytochrome c oxidase subunit 2
MKYIFVSFAALLLLAGCTSSEVVRDDIESVQENNAVTSETPAPGFEKVNEMVVREEAEQSSIREFTVEVGQWYYSPDLLEVSEGDTVVITAKSVDVPHSFTLPDFNDESRDNGTGGISVLLQPGQEEVITFVADKKGEFIFGCDVVCGAGHTTMMGKLIVK